MLCLLVSGCSGIDSTGPSAAAQSSSAVEVVTAAATVQPLAVALEAVGTAAANESVEVTSGISKKVTAIHFEEGDFVRRGTVLVELDSHEARAALAEAEAAFAESESRYQRSRNLFAREALSGAELDQIEATLKASRARMEAARARLEDTVIRAGFDGYTGFRRVSVGALVGPNTVITTLDDLSVIKLNCTIPETSLFLVKEGLPVVASTPALPGRTFRGQVTDLDSRVDPVTRSITIRARIPNPDRALLPGMFMTVTLQGEVVPALLVPEAAIVPEQGSTFVFVVENGLVERRQVLTGRRRPGEVEITSGLEEGERVVVAGTQNVHDGMTVRDPMGTSSKDT